MAVVMRIHDTPAIRDYHPIAPSGRSNGAIRGPVAKGPVLGAARHAPRLTSALSYPRIACRGGSQDVAAWRLGPGPLDPRGTSRAGQSVCVSPLVGGPARRAETQPSGGSEAISPPVPAPPTASPPARGPLPPSFGPSRQSVSCEESHPPARSLSPPA